MKFIYQRTKLWLRAWWRLNSHRLAHVFGWNGGNPEVWTARNGRLMVGFRCHGCGRLFHIEPCRRSMQPEEHR